jgi:hypothetical protein
MVYEKMTPLSSRFRPIAALLRTAKIELHARTLQQLHLARILQILISFMY